MALCTDAAMVLYYDIEGDTDDHDDWHSVEHFQERLSVPGFRRATRWVATDGSPRYLVLYEVDSLDVATSPGYLARLNNPTPWTQAMMPRFRGMIRGFSRIMASSGFGLGGAVAALRFAPEPGAEARLSDWLASTVLPLMAARRGMAGVHLLQPGPPQAMTREQSLRGSDAVMPWLVLATAYDADALRRAADAHLAPEAVRDHGAAPGITLGFYDMHLTATEGEAERSPAPPDDLVENRARVLKSE